MQDALREGRGRGRLRVLIGRPRRWTDWFRARRKRRYSTCIPLGPGSSAASGAFRLTEKRYALITKIHAGKISTAQAS